VQNYLTLARAEGDLAPQPHGGGMPRKIDEAGERELCALLEEKSHATLAELVEQMERRPVHVSVATMVLPSRSSTRVTPTLSLAVAVIVMVALRATVAPFAGFVIATVGGTLSPVAAKPIRPTAPAPRAR